VEERSRLNKHEWDFGKLVGFIRHAHEELAAQAGRAVNLSLTMRNWLIGAYIAEYELSGADRASYGDSLLTELAKRLTELNISNCNRRQLYRYLRFYRLYPEIVGTLSAQLKKLVQEKHDVRGRQSAYRHPSMHAARPNAGGICTGRYGQRPFRFQVPA